MADLDNQREELPRIAVDTLQDWQRVKASYTSTALAEFEKRVASRTPAEKDALKVHLYKVRAFLHTMRTPDAHSMAG